MSGQRIRGIWCGVFLSVLLAANLPAQAAVKNADVDAAIAKAKAYLYAHQNNGNWDLIPVGNFDWTVCSKPDGAQFGGPTSLVTYALLASGEKPSDPHIAQAIDWLQKAELKGTYALGLRPQVWNLIPHDPKYRGNVKKDADTLLASLNTKAPCSGMWNYMWEGQVGDYAFDHSNSQYGVLGLWACSECGLEVPDAKWKMMEDAWKAQQNPDGGWSYHYKAGVAEGSTPTMTAAGIATLFILQDELHGDAGAECKGNFKNENIEKGLKWMEQPGNFASIYNGPFAFYGLYGMERIGVAAGYKYFGTIDWYQNGAEYLLSKQEADGSWGNTTWDTSFGLLFLQRGRAPVVLNKLEYTLDSHGDTPKPANWNERPRDAANITRWIAKENESDFNWQVVNLHNSGPEDWLDAPILYLGGNQMLSFSADDEAKLKKYVQEGGLIYGNADCTNPNFADSFQRLGKKLFPEYNWVNLQPTDVIYTENYPGTKWHVKPTINVLDNGVRHLMVLCPTADFSKNWQTRAFAAKPECGEWFADLYLYAVEKKNMQFKGESYVVLPDPKRTADKSLKLARLQYTGNWNPEPGGWWRMAAILNNDFSVALQADPITLGAGKLTNDYKVAHLTGTGELKLDEPAKTELKKFIAGGGTLMVDAAGGSAAFAASAEDALTAIFAANGKLAVVPAESPVFAAGEKIDSFGYRAFARKTLGALKGSRLRAITVNGRLAIFFSGEDLSLGMVGNTVDGIVGYDPKTATAIMSDLLLYSLGGATPVVKLPSLDFKRQIVWDGEGAAAGKGWNFPGDAQTSVQPQTVEAFSGKTALEFHHGGTPGANMGWNWFGYYPETAGTDISAFTNLSFRIKFKGDSTPASIMIHLLASSSKQPTGDIDVLKIDPTAADGKWHEIVIPIKDLVATAPQFDVKKVWEFGVSVTSAAPQTFSVFIDDIGFDSRPAAAPPGK